MANIIPLPTPTYSEPSFVKPVDYSGLSKSIDNLFNAYQQGKQLALQNQMGQAQLQGAQFANQSAQAQFAMQNQGLTPQDVNQFLPQAMQPRGTGLPPMLARDEGQSAAQSFYLPKDQTAQPPIPYAQAPSTVPQFSQPVQQRAQPLPEDARISTLRNIMQMHLQGQQIGAMGQVAGLQKVQAEASKASAEAGLTSQQAKMLEGSDGTIGHFVDQIKSGKMKYDDLSNLGRGEVANAIRTGVGNALAAQGVDIQTLTNKADASNSLAKTGAIPLANTKSLQSALDVLESLNEDTPRDSIQLINKLGLEVAAQRGDRPAQRLLNQSAIVSDMFQSNFGGGSDKKLELASRLSDAKQKTSQLADTIKLMRADLKNRESSFKGEKGTEHPNFSDKKTLQIGRFTVEEQ